LPDRRSADEDLFGAVDLGSRLPGELSRIRQVPKVDVSIEQQPHALPSNASSNSAGSGPSKSAAILIFPFRNPGLRTRPLRSIGTSLAMGLPALAMMISAPPLTSSTSRDRFVFAS